jgi:hypothetical protein
VYVADFANHRVQQFTTAGAFVRMWGKDVSANQALPDLEICSNAPVGDCKVGVAGGAEGELNLPIGIDAHSGNVYVTDINDRVSQFLSNGPFVRAWGKDVIPGGSSGFEVCNNVSGCQAATSGSAAGELSSPHGIATDASNHVYVADRTNSRIQEFTSTGGFVKMWGRDVSTTGGTGFEVCSAAANCKDGENGGGPGELSFPTGIGIEGNTLYVGDNDNDRVDQFTLGAAFAQAWGKDVVPGGEAGFVVCTASCQAGTPGDGSGEFDTPRGIATRAGNVYVAELGNDRVQTFRPFVDPAAPPVENPPSNEFEIGKLKGKKLKVEVPGPGEIEVTDAADAAASDALAAAKKKLLKPSGATAAAAGTVTVKLKLVKAAKRKLKAKGKVKVSAAVSFTPTGGSANTETAKLKVKQS